MAIEWERVIKLVYLLRFRFVWAIAITVEE